MTADHPITPPPELVQQWFDTCVLEGVTTYDEFKEFKFAAFAAQWGADQELEACCEWFQSNGYHEFLPDKLRDARRPKPPSLKEQALQELKTACKTYDLRLVNLDTIRRALEQLPDNE